MKKPKAFCCYLDNIEVISMLSDEQAGKLWKQLYSFSNYGEVPDNADDTGLKVLFKILSSQISRDFEKYAKKIESASKGGKKKKENSDNKKNSEQL